MYKETPWTVDDEKIDKLTKRQKNYNKNRIGYGRGILGYHSQSLRVGC